MARVVVVDDDVQALQDVTYLLTQYEHESQGFRYAAEALEHLRNTTADLVITDINMPVMDGFQLRERVRAGTSNPHVPFIFLATGDASLGLAARLEEEVVVIKPVQKAGFLRVVDSIVGGGGDASQSPPKLVAFQEVNVVSHSLQELIRRLRQNDELRNQFAEEVLGAQDEERRRIAQELHDETQQKLASLLLRMRALEAATNLEETRLQAGAARLLVSEIIEEIDRIARGLHPAALADFGLRAALERTTAEWSKTHNIEIDVLVSGLDGISLSKRVETNLYRIIQEALTNIAKHSGAKRAGIDVQVHGEEIRVVIEDDGFGVDLDPATNLPHSTGLGVHGIRGRVSQLGGTLQIESSSSSGTAIYITVPVMA